MSWRASRSRKSVYLKYAECEMPSRLLQLATSRRLIALGVLMSIVFALLPMVWSVPERHHDKDRSTPFPCQNRPCGCRTAEQCWKKCCCFTNAQKVAWANQQGIRPPAAVLTAAIRETKSEARTVASCCAGRASTKKTCSSAGGCEMPAASRPLDRTSASSRIVIGAFYQQCSGTDWGWLVTPSLLVCSVECVVVPAPVPMTDCAPPGSDRLSSRVVEPPVPPPRWRGLAHS